MFLTRIKRMQTESASSMTSAILLFLNYIISAILYLRVKDQEGGNHTFLYENQKTYQH